MIVCDLVKAIAKPGDHLYVSRNDGPILDFTYEELLACNMEVVETKNLCGPYDLYLLKVVDHD